MTLMNRIKPHDATRVVVKVGSSSVSGENASKITQIVDALASLVSADTEVVLVSSGAISTGIPLLALSERPDDLATQQAAAAVGQSVLVHRYQEELNRYAIVGAQVLLTASDMQNSTHKSNARQAMDRLLCLGVLPIVNENDTVATQEIRFGDNDHLAALVTTLIDADLLILLSDTDALYTKPPHQPGAERIANVGFGDDLKHVVIGEAGSGWGTGGAVTKVAAAQLATSFGAGVILGATDDIARILDGESLGTWFEPGTVS
jgi:glutamate 5-kinase